MGLRQSIVLEVAYVENPPYHFSWGNFYQYGGWYLPTDDLMYMRRWISENSPIYIIAWVEGVWE